MSKNTQTDASDGSELKPEFPENSYLSENEKSFFESEQEPQEFNVLDTRYTFIYQCPLCFYKDRYLKNVLKHFKVVHKLKFEFQNVQFKKFAKFDVWKRQLELDTGTHYQLSCAKRIGNLTYNCHHSIKPSIIGTNVIYNVCPANIVVIPTATKYLVHLTKTHLGHEDITLTHSEREQIFEELLGTVSLPIILDEAAEWSRHMQTVHPLHRTLFEIPSICKSHPASTWLFFFLIFCFD